MKMRSVNIIILLLLLCNACVSATNWTVYFVSRNFYNVLHWKPVKPVTPGEEVLYTVLHWNLYKTASTNDIDQQFRIKEDCHNITALTCDLTAETPAAPDVHYRAEVLVNGRSLGKTLRFKPIADTTLGAPILSTYTTVSSLNVDVMLPMGPNGASIKDIINGSKNGPSKAAIYYDFEITEPEWAIQRIHDNTIGKFVINLRNNQKKQKTKYCGRVFYRPSFELGRNKSEIAPFCVTLQSDHQMLLSWLISSAVLLAAIVVMSVAGICIYVKAGKHDKMPEALNTPADSLGKALQPAFSPVITSKAVISTNDPPSDPIIYAKIQVKQSHPSVASGGYAPQAITIQDWQNNTFSSVGTQEEGPSPQGTSAQSSEIYSAVVVHVSGDESEGFQQAMTEDRETCDLPSPPSGQLWGKGETNPNWTSCRLQASPDLDACESNPAGPLRLHTVRNGNGQLMLLNLQFGSSTDDTLSPLNLERRPLLSDVIDCKQDGPTLASLQSFDGSEFSDSGCDDSTVNSPTQQYCNSHYFPSQKVVPDFQQQCRTTLSSDGIESGYKENWLPAMALMAASKRQL
ncbi:hypothetical protein INR49_001502 [Caranx melampygus]|nr:hypothetical protein INR49_001502 [Caranx melampygus]